MPTRKPATPLKAGQIEAANRLYRHLTQWERSDSVLGAIALKFPEFDPDACLLKAVAVNSLYGTNVLAIVRMANHIQQLIQRLGAGLGTEIVDLIATLPRVNANEKQRHFVSFASKFAHFFIDQERLPILDSYAERMLRYHLGGATKSQLSRYEAFVANLQRLREQIRWTGSDREFDHYLWLAGQHQAWKRNNNAQINSELRALFETSPDDAQRDLATLSS